LNYRKKNRSLVEENEHYERNIKSLEEELRSIKSQLEGLNNPQNSEGINVLMKEIDILKDEKEKSDIELNKRITQIFKLREIIGDKENYISSLSEQLEKEKKNDNITKENVLMRLETNKIMEEVKKLRSDNQVLQYELSTKGYEVTESGEKISELFSTIDKYKKRERKRQRRKTERNR